MSTNVIKRDGRKVAFDKNKITNAIISAMKKTEKGEDFELAEKISSNIEKTYNKERSVEEIQDLVEKELLKSRRKDAAKEYIIYRENRNIARRAKTNNVFVDIISAKSNDITRENANMNADTPAGMMMKFASETSKQFVKDYLLSPEVKEAIENWIVYPHDLDYYATRSVTCCQHPLDKILEQGFIAGHGEVRPAKRIETASILACISLETAQNEMHGGQAIPAFDFYLAPYVRYTFIEEIKNIEKLQGVNLKHLYNIHLDDYLIKDVSGLNGEERIIQHAVNETTSRVHQAMESFIHNANCIHSRGGNQVVFSSINYGTDTSAEGRCIIRELLLSTENGVGNGSTAIFPIQIWKLKRGVSYLPEDPNYDLYKLACKVTAHRFFPNFVNLDATFNKSSEWNKNDPKRYEHEVATMGCVDGNEVITYKVDNKLYVSSFKRFWDHMKCIGDVKSAREEGYSYGEYIDLKNVKIQDEKDFVDCLRIIKNPDQGDWTRISLSNGRIITTTSNHPWTVKNKGLTFTKDLKIGDVIPVTTYQPVLETENNKKEDEAWLLGFILCDGCYDKQMMSTIGLNELDIKDKYCKIFEELTGDETRVHEQHRGIKGNYIELKNKGTIPFSKNLINEFGGLRKIERSIPSWVFNSTENIRASFLAGMVDADGYLKTKYEKTICTIGSTNKELAIQTALLAQSLGASAKIYENHYYSSRPDAIRYKVEFYAFDLLIRYMACGKKTSKYVKTNVSRDFNEGVVSKIEYLGSQNKNSYDVTTSSEHFIVSGIRSHNCRTRVFDNKFGPRTSIGRGNLSFTTINIVRLAIESMNEHSQEEKTKKFFEKLDYALNIAAKQLNERFNFQKEALAKQFPLLMSKLWLKSESLKPEDKVEPILNVGTLGIGFIGLAECLICLTGKHHGESSEAQELGLKIISYMRDSTVKFSDQYKHNFSIIGTPAEGLSGKFTKVDKAKYGIIKGVTDKDYYTNSSHVPVYYKCSISHKAKIEAPYHELELGGHIFYAEVDGDATKNPEAVSNIVDIMMKNNIGYGSINHTRNRCMDCGNETADKDYHQCHVCGSQNIDQIQRITGYLVGSTSRWNSAKRAELRDRVTHE